MERVDFMGAIASVERAELGEVELDVLSWLTAEWWEQGAPLDGVTRFTWYRLGHDMWGVDPSGRHRAILQDAIDDLMGAVVTLSGFNVHTGEPSAALFSDVHLLRSVVRPRPRGARVDPALDGAKREDTVEVRLEDWIVAQLLGAARRCSSRPCAARRRSRSPRTRPRAPSTSTRSCCSAGSRSSMS